MKLLFTILTVVGIATLLSLWHSDAFGENGGWLFWLGVVAIASLVLPAVFLPIVIVRLAPDHFVASTHELNERRTGGGWVLFVLRNVLGVLLFVAGVALLFLPGQGLLTMLIGLLIVDLPGKRAIELRLVRRPAILGELNALRARYGKPPFVIDGDGAG
ncbi:MAG: hypothetical protein H6838_10970 [Planctomycetes bacterium]|nr:hypothetical protein [Planctomycetota bacterium]MCB9886008.1 hypothetical protein [Planctomycetota bacterium]